MLNVSAVSALVFYIRNLERTESFYRDVLGLNTERMESHDGTILMAEASNLSLVFIPAEEPAGRSPVAVFGLEGGIEDVVEELVRQNVEIVVPVSEAPDGGLTADFLDPDGHTLSFYQEAGRPRRIESQ